MPTGKGVTLKLALETALNLATSDNNFAVSGFADFVFPSPAGLVRDVVAINRAPFALFFSCAFF